jgi:L-fucose isomerase-like protein
MHPPTFALFFGNRGFFPESLIAKAREEMTTRLTQLGYGSLVMDPAATRYGAVESVEDGRKYARFLDEHRGRFDGVILCLPNFGDETGAVAALQDARVPILVHAYPDELDKMGVAERRDAFCGKFSIMDVFCQYRIPFTTFPPHTVHPHSADFAGHLRDFAAVCRVHRGMRRLVVGALGARTTAFKTVRFDELALQRHGITTETLDLSMVIQRVRQLSGSDPRCRDKAKRLRDYTRWNDVPDEAFGTLVKLAVVIDQIVEEFRLDALAIRCWLELEQELKVAPCVVVSEMNDRLIPVACEVDVCNAVAMHALQLASGKPAACLDWNNNYGDEPDKCILFHCGPVPQYLMTGKGQVVDHPMFVKALGAGCGWGPNVGRIAASPMTYASAKTEDGKLSCYVGEGEMTADPIPDEFFGCAGVAHIDGLQRKLNGIGHVGFRHHVSMTFGRFAVAIREAFTRYLRYEVIDL